MRFRSLLGLSLTLVATGCVSPLVNFTAYAIPYVSADQFDNAFAAWKAGQNVSWQMQYRGSDLSNQTLLLQSTGTCSITVSGQSPQTFTATQAQLAQVVSTMQSSKLFSLYDGLYAPYLQSSGPGAQDIDVKISGIEKHVSRDPNLATSVSWEANAIASSANVMVSLARLDIK